MKPDEHFRGRSLGAFRNALAQCPTPGCGAAAAVTADFALALIQKGITISAGADSSARNLPLVKQLSACSDKLANFAEDDAAAFSAYLKSKREDKENGYEGAHQGQPGPAELISEVPLNAAQTCSDALLLVGPALTQTSARLRSDVLAGARLLHCALGILLGVVGDNLSVLDESSQLRIKRRRQALQYKADQVWSGLGMG